MHLSMSPTTPISWPVRALTDDDWDELTALDSHAFGFTLPDEAMESAREVLRPARNIGAYDGGTLTGIATAYAYDLSLPGGSAPAAAISWVGVLPTYRRRGVLRALMTHQLHSVHDEGREPVAILWASEPQIYGRFGYGLASRHLELTVPRDPQALLPSAPHDASVHMRLVDASDWKLTADVYAEVRALRPGAPVRDELWWKHAVQDIVAMRDGRSALRCVVAEDDTGVRGYARYATKDVFEGWVSAGKVMVREVMALDAAASAALYRYLFDLDLMGTTLLGNVPVDDPLLLWLQNPRKAQPVLGDSLYVRLVDLDRALEARTYAAPVDIVLEVTDDLCPWNAGRWRLTGGPDRETTCEQTTDGADLALGVVDLGAAYLGGTSLHELALAGRVSELHAGTLAAAATAFAHTPAPWSPAVF